MKKCHRNRNYISFIINHNHQASLTTEIPRLAEMPFKMALESTEVTHLNILLFHS